MVREIFFLCSYIICSNNVASLSSDIFELFKEKHKLWGGRFSQATNPTLESLNSSIDVDKRLFEEDIVGSIAYAQALRNVGLLTLKETEEIHRGLALVRKEWEKGEFKIEYGDEDIHTANERRLKVRYFIRLILLGVFLY